MNDQEASRGWVRLPEGEVANSISHALGLVAAIVAGPVLVMTAASDGNTSYVVGVAVFAISVVILI